MGGDGLVSATKFLVITLSALYVAAGVAGPFLFDWSTGRDVAWVSVLIAGAAVMLIGQFAVPRGRASAALVTIGALGGGFPLFWTLLVPIAVAAVIACSFALARRTAPAA